MEPNDIIKGLENDFRDVIVKESRLIDVYHGNYTRTIFVVITLSGWSRRNCESGLETLHFPMIKGKNETLVCDYNTYDRITEHFR